MMTIERVLRLSTNPQNPRNSEGAFIALRDGRILFVYTHFTGGRKDDASAHLAGRYSEDGGATWTDEDVLIVPNEGGQNVMSVSFLRLQSGEIGLFYLVKNSLTDCRPHLRISTDEARTWGPAHACITDKVGYYVLNNDRVAQLADGRLVMPVAQHHAPEWEAYDRQGLIMCYLSDDNGATWRRSRTVQQGFNEQGERIAVQEPGVVELKDGRLWMYCRTDAESQYVSWSEDRGDSWSPLVASSITSPVSPASVKRIPATSDLLLVWNDHRGRPPAIKTRTPLSAAISGDEGRTWSRGKVLEDDPHGRYCYTAIHFTAGHVLLGYYAADMRPEVDVGWLEMVRFPVEYLYDAPA